jgi:hypothetical protein
MSAAELGLDRSGNNNNFTVTNITVSDQVLDSPTNNFCILNILSNNGTVDYSEGNLKATGASNHSSIIASIGQTTGKWYFEMMRHTHKDWNVGITENSYCADTNEQDTAGSWGFYGYSGSIRENGGSSASYDSEVASDGDIVMVAYDLDNQKIWYGKNGTWLQSGNPATGADAASTNLVAGNTYSPFLHTGNDGAVVTVFNFGQDSSFAGSKTAQGNQDGNDIGDFYYTPPTGFLALCTSNLPDATVTPSENFTAKLYTGNGTDASTTQVITTDIQPDFVWMKSRSHVTPNRLVDAVRGVDVTLYSDGTGGDYANAGSDITALGSTSFTLTGDGAGTNSNGRTYVAWNWKAGGGAGSSNEDGSINTTSTSVNVDAGFSISTYTGTGSAATIGHGLSKAPDLIIVKKRNTTGTWVVYHSSNTAAPETDILALDENAATYDNAAYWNDTAPTADVFSVGTSTNTNESSATFVNYNWHSVDGYSKFGSYVGNGSVNGTFVYTGFRPAYVLVKRSSDTEGWYVKDIARNPNGNEVDLSLSPNDNSAEFTTIGSTCSTCVDFLSNGFKLRGDDTQSNAASTYIYLAFAETPFKYSNAR